MVAVRCSALLVSIQRCDGPQRAICRHLSVLRAWSIDHHKSRRAVNRTRSLTVLCTPCCRCNDSAAPLKTTRTWMTEPGTCMQLTSYEPSRKQRQKVVEEAVQLEFRGSKVLIDAQRKHVTLNYSTPRLVTKLCHISRYSRLKPTTDRVGREQLISWGSSARRGISLRILACCLSGVEYCSIRPLRISGCRL